tara:strand:+ start:435 stop:788 length:354 start_codon:yes stop_codon:yes gene_type:complete
MNMNRQLGLRAPSRFASMEGNFDPIEPEFTQGAQDLDAIAEQGGRDLVNTAKDVAEDAVEKGKEIGSLVVGEGEKALGALSRSTGRLDAQERVFSFLPNSILVYGLVGFGIYYLTKK